MTRGRRLVKRAAKRADAEDTDGASIFPMHQAYRAMAADQALLDELSSTPDYENAQRVAARIRIIWDANTQVPPHPQLASNFLSWAGHAHVRDSLPLQFSKILKDRRAATARFYSAKHRLINFSNLNPRTTNKAVLLSRIPIRKCARLGTAFPPPLLYVSETQSIYDRNMAFVLERDLPDDRIPRKYIFQLNDPSTWGAPADTPGLVHDLGADQSAQFVNETGDLVAVVIRNACKDRRVIEFADRSVDQTVATRRNACKEDRGHISQMGLSAGSRSQPKLGWVRNIERQKRNEALHDKVNYDASSSFAVLWSLARSLLPDIIIDDFNDFIQSLGPDVRMDGNGTMACNAAGKGGYHIQAGDFDFKFNGVELAPPCGVMAENYCRYIHFENQPHAWAVSLTTSRSFDPDISSLDAGGHFYISAYGIRVQAARGTLIAWRPKDWHGTSLFLVNPDPLSPEKQYYQRGLCIVTGNRIVNAVKKWRAGGASETELDEIEGTIGCDHAASGEPGSNELDQFIADLQTAPLRRSDRLAAKPRKSFVGY